MRLMKRTLHCASLSVSSDDLKQKKKTASFAVFPLPTPIKIGKFGVSGCSGKTMRATQSGTMFHGKSFVVMFYAIFIRLMNGKAVIPLPYSDNLQAVKPAETHNGICFQNA